VSFVSEQTAGKTKQKKRVNNKTLVHLRGYALASSYNCGLAVQKPFFSGRFTKPHR
jgi:hypothetical protein